MKILYSKDNILHIPGHEFFAGELIDHNDNPKRVEIIVEALTKNNFQMDSQFTQVPMELVKEVHSENYIKFFEDASDQLIEDQVMYPSVFVDPDNKSTFLQTRLGKYSYDTYTPVRKMTYKLALDSASVAYTAALNLIQNKNEITYALSRPPGHHAEIMRMGGGCYLNNTAIAANYLSKHGKVAILDIDYHHGNGTQNIFYKRSDVTTVSIHATPNKMFPFTGFEDEIGDGEGRGYCKNYPLELGIKYNEFEKTLLNAIVFIKNLKPDFLVVALGYDTFKFDPVGKFLLEVEDYRKIAETIKSLGLPMIVVQEGGYNLEFLGDMALSFVAGL